MSIAESAAPRVRCVSFDPETKRVRRSGAESVADELADDSVFTWIDVQGDGAIAFGPLLAKAEVDAAPLRGLDAPEILPRIVESKRCVSFHLHEIVHPERHLDTTEGLSEFRVARLAVVLGADFVFTFHNEPVEAVEEIQAQCEDAFRLAGKTPGFIVFLLLQRCLYDFAELNLANDNFLDGLEPSVAPSRRELAGEVAVAGRNILSLKKLTTSLHIVLMLLATKRSPFVSEAARASYREMLDNALAVRAAVDSSRDLLDGVVAAMHAESAQRTSDVAAVLTVVSVIMLPLGLIAGMWGMNFKAVPMDEHPHGFWWMAAFMAAVAAAVVLLFRRLGWIGRK